MRTLLLFAAALAFLVAPGAGAQRADQAPMRIVIPYPPGGTADFFARAFADKFRTHANRTVIVENRPGANGGIGAQAVAKAPTDGSVLLFAAGSMLVINPHLYRSLQYDPVNDFTPIARIAVSASVLAIRSTIPAATMPELVAWARSSGRPLRVGSSGIGSIGHLWSEQLRASTGLDVLHVPYKGIAQVVSDMMGDQIDGIIVDLAGVAAQASAGKVRLIGLVGASRNASVPSMPTLAEQGFPRIDGLSWYGILGPAKMSPDTVRRLVDAIGRTLAEPELADKLKAVGMEPALQGPEEFARTIRSETEWWARLIAERKIKVEE